MNYLLTKILSLKSNKKVKCERKGQYKQYCVDSKDKSKLYNKKVYYNKKFKCLNEAKCEYKDKNVNGFRHQNLKNVYIIIIKNNIRFVYYNIINLPILLI